MDYVLLGRRNLMNSKLCQIIAVEKTVKNKAHSTITDTYQMMQKTGLFVGLSRAYKPLSEEGEQLPTESSKVQANAANLINQVSSALTELFDVTLTKDVGNCSARADVVVGDVVIARAVPVTYLLFLEKKLIDLHTFVSKLPVLDPSEEWTYDPNVDCYASKSSETVRTKKVFVPLVLSPATDKHPAQVKEGFEDKVVGTWRAVKFSGALPAQRVATMLERVEKLQRAVKFAREEANATQVESVKIGEKLLNFVFDR
jgi:hypothetical protein